MYTNYKYVVTPNKIIALSTYAGRTVRGIAKCHPNDTFNEEFGKTLAAARCNQKIAAKRYARAQKEYNQLCAEIKEFNARAIKVSNYLKDAAEADKEAIEIVRDLKNSLKYDS